MNLPKYFWHAVVIAILTLTVLISCVPSASADEIPSPEDVSTAEPAPEDVQHQLPEEIIGRQIECPDGTVGRIISVVGNTDCAVPMPRQDGPPAVRTPVSNPSPEPVPTTAPEPSATPTPEAPTSTPEPSQEPPAAPPTEPSTTPTPTPLPDCTDPMVECSCDHFIGGCTGGNPPDGEGTPFPGATAETDVSEKSEIKKVSEKELILAGGGISLLLILCVGLFAWDYRRTQ